VKVLLVKMSSLGDVIHTLPALGDAVAARPDVRFDWVVEEGFAEIPGWHPAVDQVIPAALRRWRKRPLKYFASREWRDMRNSLRECNYDAVIDAQGLLKSAFVSRLVRAPRYGMDKATVRERLAALAYDHPIHVPRDMHAVARSRLLFAGALDYPLPEGLGDYGLGGVITAAPPGRLPALLFFHGSARAEKLWPEDNWVVLAELAAAEGYRVWLPWGNQQEQLRAQRIASATGNAEVLPRQTLRELAGLLQGVSGAVAVDTGLGHLSAALSVPTVSLYGPTSTRLVGAYGRNQVHIQSPLKGADNSDPPALMQTILPDTVWRALQGAVAGAG
jgi:heptosyltransferase-1